MKAKVLLVGVLICSFSGSVHATSWANTPTLDFPETAIRNCIEGKVIVQFRVVDGHPVDISIVTSEPDGLYTDAFLDWWSRYDEWRRHVGMRWDEDTEEGEPKEIAFNFAPCEDLE